MELEHNLIDTSCEDSEDDGSFSEDLLMEIFRRLPPKSLFRFKCVSKAWESLISVESFQTRLLLSMSGLFYSVRVANNVGHSELKEDKYYCLSDEKSDDGINLSFLTSHLKFRIIDSCSGLLLCLCTEGRRVSFVVCNPLTRRWAPLPMPTARCSLNDARLIFDYQSSPHFQVVIVSGPFDSYIKLHSFSSETGKWIESKLHCEFLKHSLRVKDGVYSNGTLYMYAYIFPCRRVVVGINLKEESCRIIELPVHEDCYGVLGKNSGYLYYITHNRYLLQIWMLKEDSTSDWVSKYNITVEALRARASLPVCRRSFRDYQSYHLFHPLAFHPDLEVVFLRTHCKTFSYNFRSMRLEELWGFSSCSPSITSLDTSTYIYAFSVFPYTPCLNPSSIN